MVVASAVVSVEEEAIGAGCDSAVAAVGVGFWSGWASRCNVVKTHLDPARAAFAAPPGFTTPPKGCMKRRNY